jgi:hypothetical protein
MSELDDCIANLSSMVDELAKRVLQKIVLLYAIEMASEAFV